MCLSCLSWSFAGRQIVMKILCCPVQSFAVFLEVLCGPVRCLVVPVNATTNSWLVHMNYYINWMEYNTLNILNYCRVTTNLENLEYGILREISASSGKYDKYNSFSMIAYLHRRTVDWVNRIIVISWSCSPQYSTHKQLTTRVKFWSGRLISEDVLSHQQVTCHCCKARQTIY